MRIEYTGNHGENGESLTLTYLVSCPLHHIIMQVFNFCYFCNLWRLQLLIYSLYTYSPGYLYLQYSLTTYIQLRSLASCTPPCVHSLSSLSFDNPHYSSTHMYTWSIACTSHPSYHTLYTLKIEKIRGL